MSEQSSDPKVPGPTGPDRPDATENPAPENPASENPASENPASENPAHQQPVPEDEPQASGLQEPAEPEAPETRDEEMLRLRAEVDAANRRVVQAQADAENFRKRMRRDYEDQLKYATMPLVADLLQVRDNLTRALEASAAAAGAEGLGEGVAMVAKQLDDILAKYGVREIPAEGELFDPNVHEAVSQMPSPEHASGMISHVAVPGFQMHERVIRPSQVVVSTGPPN